MKVFKTIAAALLLCVIAAADAFACSRVVYLGDAPQSYVLVGRTLDWRTPIPTNLYVYPRGMERQSMSDGPMLRWTSRYASVLAVGYDGGVTEGMNEKGLVMNGLFCKEAVYPVADSTDNVTPVMSLSVLVSYFLDNFATVDEAEAWLNDNEFAIAGKSFDEGTSTLLHWAITDRTGMTLLLEYDGGKLTLFKGRDLQVLTNDPLFTQMQSIEKYWQGVGGTNMLPGTVKSADRFVRASFFVNHVPTNVDYHSAWGSISSIMGTVSVPYGYELPGEPNVSSTQWRSIADLGGLKYYLKFADSTSDFWIDLEKLLLNPGDPVLKLDTKNHFDFSGCVNDRLKVSKPFTPMW